MPTSYPYTPSGGPIVAIVQQLRRSFPAAVDASTLKKLAIAPKNESYVLGVLRFLGVLDKEGKKVEKSSKVFLAQDESFQKGFSELVKSAYHDLFSLHGDAAWKLDTNGLISFFRNSAESTQIVGQRQANTFKTLSALSGHAEVNAPRSKPAKADGKASAEATAPYKRRAIATASHQPPTTPPPVEHARKGQVNPFGLTVRIEVNLPASADQETYDRIFQSIRKNLINSAES